MEHQKYSNPLFKRKYLPSSSSPIGKAELSWNRYYSICNSQVFDIFGGQFESIIRCDTCNFESPTYETFWDLSLPIPAPDANGSVSLVSCLKEFGKRESLEAEWSCSRCKTRRSATKSISIFRCPEILVIRKVLLGGKPRKCLGFGMGRESITKTNFTVFRSQQIQI
jgi:ubiquitin C-terminal hydrolase